MLIYLKLCGRDVRTKLVRVTCEVVGIFQKDLTSKERGQNETMANFENLSDV